MTNFKLLMSQIRHGSDQQRRAALDEMKTALQALISMIDEYEERSEHDGEKERTEKS